jgi:hypothetical protein
MGDELLEQFEEIVENLQADVHREMDRADKAERELAEALHWKHHSAVTLKNEPAPES